MSLPMNILNLDCVELMARIGDKEADFTFWDPPYNVKKKYDGYDDNLPPVQYRLWMERMVSESRRISKRGFGVYVGATLTRLFMQLMPDAHLIIVHKRAVGPMKGGYLLQYHSLLVEGEPLIKCKDLWDDVRLPGEGYFFREDRFDDHPGQTSLQLTKKVLHHFTAPGDIVVDPFLGTGTTAVAAISMGRGFVGGEQSRKYFDTAVFRASTQAALEIQPGYVPTVEGESDKKLTRTQQAACDKLTNEWKSSHVLGVPLPTLDALVAKGKAEKKVNDYGFDILSARSKRKMTLYKKLEGEANEAVWFETLRQLWWVV